MQVSSIGVSAFPLFSAYHACKWALESFSQSLAQEVAEFGINVTLIGPDGFSTDWAGPSAQHTTELAAYDWMRDRLQEQRARRTSISGDPQASSAAILKIVDAEKSPLRIFLGGAPLAIAAEDYGSRLAQGNQWQQVAVEAQG